MFGKERRTERRYYFQQPAFLRLQHINVSEVETVTENVSTHGLLLGCEALVALGSTVNVILSLPYGFSLLEGAGKVCRVEKPSAGGAFLVAVRCEAPLKILRNSKPVSAITMQGGEHLA
jgi:PilZ domain-containing protein